MRVECWGGPNDGLVMQAPDDISELKWAQPPGNLGAMLRHPSAAFDYQPITYLTAIYYRGISKLDGTVIFSYGGTS